MQPHGLDNETGQKVNVLTVDDRPEILIALAAILNSSSLNVVPAQSAREALEALDQDEPVFQAQLSRMRRGTSHASTTAPN